MDFVKNINGHNLLKFSISYLKTFLQLIKFNITYLLFLNSFLLTFSVFLKGLRNYFFRWLFSEVQQISSVIKLYMWSSKRFSAFSCFPRFLWSRFFRVQFFRVQVFLGPVLGSQSRLWVQILEVAQFGQQVHFLKIAYCFSPLVSVRWRIFNNLVFSDINLTNLCIFSYVWPMTIKFGEQKHLFEKNR